jgi:hypothetical protein
MSKTVGHGEQFAINLDEPLSQQDRQYLQDRDPKFRDILGGTPAAEEQLPDTYDEWTVPQLQDELAARDLPTSGRKQELIDRLAESD